MLIYCMMQMMPLIHIDSFVAVAKAYATDIQYRHKTIKVLQQTVN